jgi:Vitamin K-dependent gamma-carboxylase
VLVLSLHAKSPLILFGADGLLAVLLFWGMWLPLGRHWSIDALRSFSHTTGSVRSGGSLGMTLQVAIVYWMNAITKGGAEWRGDFTSVERTLKIDYFSTEFGEYLLQFPNLLKVGTCFTLYLEELVPFFLFLPFFNGHLKTLAVLLMVAFHLGMLGTTMNLGIFPFIGAIAWLPFLPSTFWNRFSKAREKQEMVQIGAPAVSWVICGCCLMLVFLWNLRHALRQEDPWYFPKSLSWIGKVTRLQQRWSLFAPRVNTTDGWIVVDATLKNGTHVDIMDHGREINFTRPEEISSRYKSCRERTYVIYIFQTPDFQRTELFAQSLENRWMTRGGSEIQSLKIYMMHENNRTPEKGTQRFQMWPYEVETVKKELKFKEKPMEMTTSN